MGQGSVEWGKTIALGALFVVLLLLFVLPSAIQFGPVLVRSFALIGALFVLVMLLGLVNQTVVKLRGGERDG